MTTKVWERDLDERAYTRAALLNLDDFTGINTIDGDPQLDRFPVARIRIEQKYPPSDYFRVGLLFIVSDALAEVLGQFPVRIELHPVEVIFKGVPYEHKRFFFLNILDEADCLDRLASKYVERSGYFGDVSKLVLDEAKTEGKCLFRLARFRGLMVLASEPLAAAVGSSDVTGVRFIDPSSWRR
jgi:hypothetical protein